MCTQTRAAALMANIPQADIDPSGVFKYVLIRVHSKEEGDDAEVDIVRGYGWAEYHGESAATGGLQMCRLKGPIQNITFPSATLGSVQSKPTVVQQKYSFEFLLETFLGGGHFGGSSLCVAVELYEVMCILFKKGQCTWVKHCKKHLLIIN